MRGKPSVFVRAGKLEAVLARRAGPRRPRSDFSVFDDAELEDLAALAAKAAAADGPPAWSEDDRAVLSRLEPKLVMAAGTTR